MKNDDPGTIIVAAFLILGAVTLLLALTGAGR